MPSERNQRSASSSGSKRKPKAGSFASLYQLKPLRCDSKLIPRNDWEHLERRHGLALTTSQAIEQLLFCNSAELVANYEKDAMHMLQNCVTIQGRVPSSKFIERMFVRIFDIEVQLPPGTKTDHDRERENDLTHTATNSKKSNKKNSKNKKDEANNMYDDESSSDDDEDDDDEEGAERRRIQKAAAKYETTIDAVDRDARKIAAKKISVVVLGSNPTLLFVLIRFLEQYRSTIPASRFVNSWKPLSWSTIECPLQSLCHAAQRGSQLVKLNKSAAAVAIAVDESRVCAQLLSFVLFTIRDTDSCLVGKNTSGLLERLMGHTKEPGCVATLNRANMLIALVFINLCKCLDSHPNMRPKVGRVLDVLCNLLRALRASAIASFRKSFYDKDSTDLSSSIYLPSALDSDTRRMLGLVDDAGQATSTVSAREKEKRRWQEHQDAASYSKRILTAKNNEGLEAVVEAVSIEEATMIADGLAGALAHFNMPLVTQIFLSKPIIKFGPLPKGEQTSVSTAGVGLRRATTSLTFNRRGSIGNTAGAVSGDRHTRRVIAPVTPSPAPSTAQRNGARSNGFISEGSRKQWQATPATSQSTAHRTATLSAFSSPSHNRTTTISNGETTNISKSPSSASKRARAASIGARDAVVFKVRDRVEGKFDTDEWYPGVVKALNKSGTVHVVFNDGEIVRDFETSQLRQIRNQGGNTRELVTVAAAAKTPTTPQQRRQENNLSANDDGSSGAVPRRSSAHKSKIPTTSASVSVISSTADADDDNDDDDSDVQWLSTSPSKPPAPPSDNNSARKSRQSPGNTKLHTGPRSIIKARNTDPVKSQASPSDTATPNRAKQRLLASARSNSLLSRASTVAMPRNGKRNSNVEAGEEDAEVTFCNSQSSNPTNKLPAVTSLASSCSDNDNLSSSSSSVQLISPEQLPPRLVAYKKIKKSNSICSTTSNPAVETPEVDPLQSLRLTREELAFVSGSASKKRPASDITSEESETDKEKASCSSRANLDEWVSSCGKKKAKKRSVGGGSSNGRGDGKGSILSVGSASKTRHATGYVVGGSSGNASRGNGARQLVLRRVGGIPTSTLTANIVMLHRECDDILIGRASNCALRLVSKDTNICLGISRRHALIKWDPLVSAHVLVDSNSANGLFVDGKRVQKGGRRQLKEGDVITFGKGEVKKSNGHTYVATTEFAYVCERRGVE